MITTKCKTSNKPQVLPYQEAYSYMFRKMYKNAELMADKNFEAEIRKQFGVDSWFYRCCKVDVEMKLAQNETNRKNKADKIISLEKSLENLDPTDKYYSRDKYKIRKALTFLRKTFKDDITFGGKDLLRRITYLSNIVNKSYKTELTDSVIELMNAKEQYRKARILPIHIIGEVNENLNRKFSFYFEDNKVVFKPKRGVNIPIEFHCGKKQQEQLIRLVKQGGQPITVQLTEDYICFTFDEQKLNGYAFNKKAQSAELKKIKKEDENLIKACKKKWAQEWESRMLVGKIEGRAIGFDLNPEYIGVAILDRINETGKYKIIHAECVSFKNFSTKLGLSPTDLAQVYQNNKRIHEICEAWKYIFKLAEHYKVSICVEEDLEFKDKGVNDAVAEANRKTKNIWHRTKTENLINKYCSIKGLKLEKVNAAYSSFVGNIQHKYFDPVNAAIEVTRRGLFRYFKGGVWTTPDRSDLDSMRQLGLDVPNKTISTWAQAFNLFKTAEFRYRRELKNFVEYNLQSIKSGVKLYRFI